MKGPILPQFTVMQFPIAVAGVPPVIIQFTGLVAVAQYETALLGQMMVSPVMTGAGGGAITFTT
jgi:hypothetical protein